jgi:heme/copper-type cytochrome/quinol oxidase subunit 2
LNRALILVPILLLVLVGLFFALRPDSSAPESSTPGADTTSAAGGQEKTLDVAINRGAMTPDKITVNEGDRVNLGINSDSPLGFHLHGYDLEKEVEPNEPAELSFDATITGRFQIEDHDSDTELGELIVQPR